MRQYIVDTFTSELFRGNPAAVCVMQEWPDEGLMKSIARENNLSETAFIVVQGVRPLAPLTASIAWIE